jgi:hypothetical protein
VPSFDIRESSTLSLNDPHCTHRMGSENDGRENNYHRRWRQFENYAIFSRWGRMVAGYEGCFLEEGALRRRLTPGYKK